MQDKKSLYLLVAIIFIFVFFVLLRVVYFSGDNLADIKIPRMLSDDYFYYARIQEVADGYPFIGNPFYWQHRNDINSTFFLPDWFAAVPRLLGLPIFYTFVFNWFVWSILFIVSIYYLFKVFGFLVNARIFLSLLMFFTVVDLVFRPTIMQVIFPFFFLGLAIFYYWFKYKDTKYLLISTSLFLSFTFYFYQHLATLMYFIAALLGLYFLLNKKFKILIRLVISVVVSLVLSIPILWHYHSLLKMSIFNELILRIDDVFTHCPSFFVFMSGKWVLLGMLIWFLIFELSSDNNTKKLSQFLILFAIATVLTASSNIITGVKLQTAEHIYRFQMVYIGLSVFGAWFYLIKNYRQYLQKNKFLVYVLFCFILFLFVEYCSITFKAITNVVPNSDDLYFNQYNVIIDQLNNLPEESVIWADDNLSLIIPVYTKHYTLFARDGSAYLVGNNEIQQRYLLSHIFDNSQPDFKANIGLIIGYGNEFDVYKENNLWVRFCHRIKLDTIGLDCGTEKETWQSVSPDFFVDLDNEYSKIKDNYIEYLSKYRVSYLLIDREEDYFWEDFDPRNYNFELMYKDDRFDLYKIN